VRTSIDDFFGFAQFKKNEWSETHIQVDFDKPSRLPIIDIASKPTGEPEQAFWIELGMACFQH